MKTQAVYVHADRDPMPDVESPGPHQIYRNPNIAVEERELGALDPGNVRVKMVYAGICGSDIHLVQSDPATGYILTSVPTAIPAKGRLMGHEGVGQVLECGARVEHVRPGMPVAFESIIVCHHCDACRRGLFNQCRKARLLGMEEDGLFGTIVDIPSMLAHDVTGLVQSDTGMKSAACVEPAGVAYVACQNTHVSGGDIVVVFGAGPIGVLAAMLSRQIFGASRVYIVEPVEYRRQLAARWCDGVYDVDEFFDTPLPAVDVVIEASGETTNISRILRRLNANGRIALLARTGSSLTLDAVDHLITNQVSIVGSRGHLCGAFATILSLCENGRLPLHEVVTDTIAGPTALCDLLKSPHRILTENCKVLVDLRTE